MITGLILLFINDAIKRDVQITGNIGCLVMLTGCIDAVIILGAIYLFLTLK